ncbi:TSR1 ribosome maturation factor [Homo sapiens]|uniref:TSR1 ribosome maturation factor n=1 Tax=Homo sapiens TaxID=9606 RepID=I3L4T0_HUMAN|nr:TSR1 ribosome maturation factor [Homo sapiens]KAI4047055.1 TSR1 ribosome maturation factor [Homo sapiens]
MAAHRPGPLKQQNKAHKGGRHRGRGSAQRDGKGSGREETAGWQGWPSSSGTGGAPAQQNFPARGHAAASR